MNCRLLVTSLILGMLSNAALQAQEPDLDIEPVKQAEPPKKERTDLRRDVPTLSPPTTTPEMWLYEQERIRSEDPKTIVRRNAEIRYAQMQRRIESRKWYGMSNSRPVASPNPWYDTYSPSWVSNTWHPYEWSGGGYGATYRYGFIVPAY
jgi:hypothetical protein